MKKGLILCGSIDLNLSEYASIAVTNIFLGLELKKQGIEAQDLLGLEISIDYVRLLKKIDDSLHKESSERIEMRWAPLALVRVYRRYLHYAQYKQRLECWLLDKALTELVLSSGMDEDLVKAAEVVCRSSGIKLSVLTGSFDVYSGLDPFMQADALPALEDIDRPFITIFIGKLVKLLRITVMYEPYTNLSNYGKGTTTFKWWKTVAFISEIKKKFLYIHSARKNEVLDPFGLIAGAYVRHPIGLIKANNWSGFSKEDLVVINSGLGEFFRNHSIKKIERINEALQIFFASAKLKRIIILDSQIPHCRLLAYAARSSGVFVDYLPHGIVAEDQVMSTISIFSPNRILAWNDASEERYKSYGMAAIKVSHPRNRLSTHQKMQAQIPSSNEMRCLVLLPSPESYQLDVLERDFLEINDVLDSLKITAKWKLHNSNLALSIARNETIKKLNLLIDKPIEMLDPNLDVFKLANSFDLIIVGRITSAIYEAARLGVPCIVHRGELTRVGALDNVSIPCSSSSDELKKLIKFFDINQYNVTCQKLSDSLSYNESPFNLS